MKCPKCNGDMLVMTVSQKKRMGCLAITLYLGLLVVPIIGWIGLYLIIRGKKDDLVTYATCQSCGHREVIETD